MNTVWYLEQGQTATRATFWGLLWLTSITSHRKMANSIMLPNALLYLYLTIKLLVQLNDHNIKIISIHIYTYYDISITWSYRKGAKWNQYRGCHRRPLKVQSHVVLCSNNHITRGCWFIYQSNVSEGNNQSMSRRGHVITGLLQYDRDQHTLKLIHCQIDLRNKWDRC